MLSKKLVTQNHSNFKILWVLPLLISTIFLTGQNINAADKIEGMYNIKFVDTVFGKRLNPFVENIGVNKSVRLEMDQDSLFFLDSLVDFDKSIATEFNYKMFKILFRKNGFVYVESLESDKYKYLGMKHYYSCVYVIKQMDNGIDIYIEGYKNDENIKTKILPKKGSFWKIMHLVKVH